MKNYLMVNNNKLIMCMKKFQGFSKILIKDFFKIIRNNGTWNSFCINEQGKIEIYFASLKEYYFKTLMS